MTSDDYKLHAILYAKSHYKQDRKLTGLRMIAGHYGGMDPEYINDENLMYFALMLLEEYAPKTTVKDIIFSTFRDAWMWRSPRRAMKPVRNIRHLDIIRSVLLVLRHTLVKDLPPLPVASADVAPLRCTKITFPAGDIHSVPVRRQHRTA